MVPAIFVIAEVMLCANLVVAVAVYLWRPKPFLPRVPTSLVSQTAFFRGDEGVEWGGKEGEMEGKEGGRGGFAVGAKGSA